VDAHGPKCCNCCTRCSVEIDAMKTNYGCNLGFERATSPTKIMPGSQCWSKYWRPYASEELIGPSNAWSPLRSTCRGFFKSTIFGESSTLKRFTFTEVTSRVLGPVQVASRVPKGNFGFVRWAPPKVTPSISSSADPMSSMASQRFGGAGATATKNSML